jgi:hypothetical protein
MIFSAATGLYQLRDRPGVRRVATYKKVPPAFLRAHPRLLVTNVSVDQRGEFSMGREGQRAWFEIPALAGAGGMVLEWEDGRPSRLFRPVYKDQQLFGYEEVYPGTVNVFWSGREMAYSAESELYEIRETPSVKRLGAFAQIRSRVLRAYPDALVTGVKLDRVGNLTFGRPNMKPWFALNLHRNAKDLVLELSEGKPRRLFRPKFAPDGEIEGYEEIYPGDKNAFWSGRAMVVDPRTGLHEIRDMGRPEKLGAFYYVPSEFLPAHPDALVTGVNLGKNGLLTFGGTGWFSVKEHGGADKLVLELAGGEPRRLFRPVTPGGPRYEEIYPGSKNVFWTGRVVEDIPGTEFYRIRDTPEVRQIGVFPLVPQETLRAHPEALVTSVSLNKVGSLNFGREGNKPWFTLRSLGEVHGLVLELSDGKPLRLLRPAAGEGVPQGACPLGEMVFL